MQNILKNWKKLKNPENAGSEIFDSNVMFQNLFKYLNMFLHYKSMVRVK